jgi:hypothetical protein
MRSKTFSDDSERAMTGTKNSGKPHQPFIFKDQRMDQGSEALKAEASLIWTSIPLKRPFVTSRNPATSAQATRPSPAQVVQSVKPAMSKAKMGRGDRVCGNRQAR